ncbi:MAG: cob(I)yrinic acid a,c-diamide adenosyltransferase [Flavobacteriales bacterium]|nr:cob(I)yrinic acid a,c-diamide adenosyltransferase [Flavobacteriales bacterium]
MKIYTRTGDKGSTSLLGGDRVSKDDARIEAYGTVDELNAQVGMLLDLVVERACRETLLRIQHELFSIGSRLASTSTEEADRMRVPNVEQSAIDDLERTMDQWEKDLPALRNFILPGGHPSISQAHICRTVCRRAERRMVSLNGESGSAVIAVRYMNRLSDLFFMLARHLHKELKIPETPWTPRA